MFIIVGASGYLGSYLIKNILNNTNEKILATYHQNKNNIYNFKDKRIICHKLDISNFTEVDSFFKENIKHDVSYKILYLSAFHHPDQVESNPKKAWEINLSCLNYFLSKLNSNSKLYYSSTDSVYGESLNNIIFTEKDPYGPVNTYGKTKAMAEQLVLMYGFSVIRYSLLMGASMIPKQHFFDQITNCLKNNNPIDMFVDSFRSVIDFDNAANFTIKLIKNFYKPRDIINIAGDKNISKYNIAIGIAKKLDLNTNLIKPIKIKSKQNIFSTPRATTTLISNKKLKKILGLKSIKYSYE